MKKELAHYEIMNQLGAGGMGEVYLARDTRLGRSVAVKVLPEIFAQDSDRVSRFQREAKLLAALNHSNIASLFGLEEADGRHFLVMELIEGETLAELIGRGPAPLEQALKIGHQIAEAFEYAHEKGIIHRDLKPANVKVTPDGKVKVLDFGLAKAMETARPNSNMSNSPTLSMSATNAGVVLGTAAYMSPEQARGFEADPRSDIFAFGCVLYEMITGRQAFQGDTVADVLAGVLAREPDLAVLPSNINPRIIELLRRCVEKNPKRRWHAIADARVEIESILGDPRGLLIKAEPIVVKQPLWKRAIPVALAIILSATSASLATWYLKPTATGLVTRFPFAIPEGQQFTNTGRQVVAISPDGSNIVYVANQSLYLKPMHELASIMIQGSNTVGGVLNPVFSPDGRSLVYWSLGDRMLRKVSVSGGAPVTIAQVEAPFGMSWTQDDHILIGQATRGIVRVSANGGKPETIITVKENEGAHGPHLLPDGETVLYTVAPPGNDPWNRASIVVQTIGSTERKIIIEGGRDARYVPTGHIVYGLNANLLTIPFDARRLETIGGPVPIVEGVQSAGAATGTMQFSFSQNGSVVYVPGTEATLQPTTITLVDRQGSQKPLPLPQGSYAGPRISPNGREIAFVANDGKENTISIYDLNGKTAARRLSFGGSGTLPLWSSDGQYIVFRSDRESMIGLFMQRADGSGTAERITTSDGPNHTAESWFPKNGSLLYSVLSGDPGIWIYSLDDKKSAKLIDDLGFQARGVFSPDGKWIAYESDETGNRLEVFVQPYPTTGAKFQITKGGGNHPLWSPDGKQLFFMNNVSNGTLHSVDIQTVPTIAWSDPKPLPISGFFQNANLGNARHYDITPDGKQFIMVFPTAPASTVARPNLQLQVVLNWFEELKQRTGRQ